MKEVIIIIIATILMLFVLGMRTYHGIKNHEFDFFDTIYVVFISSFFIVLVQSALEYSLAYLGFSSIVSTVLSNVFMFLTVFRVVLLIEEWRE